MNILSEKEMSKKLKLTHSGLWSLIRRYDLPYISLGGGLGARFDEEDFISKLKNKASQTGAKNQ